MRIIFNWTLQEESARFTGQGVTRLEPPYKARLDLFGPRGESYLSAAAVDDELRMTAEAPAQLVPPLPLLWSALGVLKPPADAALQQTIVAGDTLTLTYTRAEERWLFRLIGWRLRFAEWHGPGAGRRTVELRGEAEQNLPQQAVYRDWAAFRELTLTLTQVHASDPFPPETWIPGSD